MNHSFDMKSAALGFCTAVAAFVVIGASRESSTKPQPVKVVNTPLTVSVTNQPLAVVLSDQAVIQTRAVGTKWKYNFEATNIFLFPSGEIRGDANRRLNEDGKAGWELIGRFGDQFVFKQPS